MVSLQNGHSEQFGYDNRGDTRLITDTSGGFLGLGVTTVTQSLSYDAQGRLSRVSTSGSGSTDGTLALTYNARGLRATYTVTPTNATQPSFSERFLYRGAQVGQVVVTGTAVTTPFTETFLYRQDGAPLELLYQPQGSGTTRYWYVLDGRENVVGLADASGALVNTYDYDLWGQPAGTNSQNEPTVHQPLRYRGYWCDGWFDGVGGWNNLNGPTAWYWLQVRSYDPELRRFLQPDPASASGLPDYVYAQDDPLDQSDPSGQGAAPVCTIAPRAVGCVPAQGDPGAGHAVYQFVVGNDLDTLRNPRANPLLRALVVLDLGSNLTLVLPGAGEGLRAGTKGVFVGAERLLSRAAEGVVSRAAEGVAAHAGRQFARMTVLRSIDKGERLEAIFTEMRDLTYETRREHALVKLLSGERAIVYGDSETIGFLDESGAPLVTRVFAHTHPYDPPFFYVPSDWDKAFIMGPVEQGGLNQTRSWLLEGSRRILLGRNGIRSIDPPLPPPGF